MAKLKAVVDKIEDVEEANRGFYTKRQDGKFELDMEGLDGMSGLSGLKSALDAERSMTSQLRTAAQAFKDIDPEKYKTMMADVQKREREDLEKKGQFEALEKQLKDQHTAELGKKDTRIGQLTKALEGSLIDAAATAAIASAKGVPELLLPHVRAKMKIVEKDGLFTAVVVDANGTPRITDGKGTPMTVEALIAEMKGSDVYGRAFEGSGATGGGKPPGQQKTQQAGTGPIVLSRADAADTSKYRAAREQAEKEHRELQIEPLPASMVATAT